MSAGSGSLRALGDLAAAGAEMVRGSDLSARAEGGGRPSGLMDLLGLGISSAVDVRASCVALVEKAKAALQCQMGGMYLVDAETDSLYSVRCCCPRRTQCCAPPLLVWSLAPCC